MATLLLLLGCASYTSRFHVHGVLVASTPSVRGRGQSLATRSSERHRGNTLPAGVAALRVYPYIPSRFCAWRVIFMAEDQGKSGRSMQSWRMRYTSSKWRLCLLFVTFPALLGGCAALPAISFLSPSIIRHLEKRPGVSVASYSHYFVRIISPNPPYKVKYTIPRHRPLHSVNLPLHKLDEGHFKSWHWMIDTTANGAALNRIKGLSTAARHSAQDEPAAALDWNAALRRLYLVDRYLLGRDPMPVQIHVILLGNTKNSYVVSETLHSSSAFPALILMPTSARAPHNGVQTLFRTLGVLQMLLADEAWKAGWIHELSVVSTSPRIKPLAVGFCWLSVGDDSLVAGSSTRKWVPIAKSFSADDSASIVRYFRLRAAAISARNSSISYAQRLQIARIWFSVDMQNYLDAHGVTHSYPQNGHDLKLINTSLNFCRDFTHDTGGILSATKSAPGFKDRPFFPATPAHASTARSAG